MLNKYPGKVRSFIIYPRFILIIIIVVFLLSLIASPVFSSPGLKVTNAAIVVDVSPGQILNQKMTVSIASDDPVTDITVSVSGVAQNISGGFQLLDAYQDTGPYSARTFITVDKDSFHLEPGASQDITATIQIPQDVGNGGCYAIIDISTKPVPESGVGIITAIDVPVYLTIKDSQLIHTGSITDISTGNITSGQPVGIYTDFENTGNHHFKIKGEVTVSNSSRVVLGTVDIPLTAGSVIPGMTRRLDASFIPQGELVAGKYTIDSKVMLEDGTLLDESTGSFEVEQAYTPPPGTIAGLASNPSATSMSSTQTTEPTAGISSTLILGVVAGAIIIVLLVLLLRQRR